MAAAGTPQAPGEGVSPILIPHLSSHPILTFPSPQLTPHPLPCTPRGTPCLPLCPIPDCHDFPLPFTLHGGCFPALLAVIWPIHVSKLFLEAPFQMPPGPVAGGAHTLSAHAAVAGGLWMKEGAGSVPHSPWLPGSGQGSAGTQARLPRALTLQVTKIHCRPQQPRHKVLIYS